MTTANLLGLGLLGALLELCGCGNGPFQSPVVKPGDPDYPVLNPSPKHMLRFTAVVPSTLSVQFMVSYQAQAGQCQRTVGLGASSQLYVSMPLQLVTSQGEYRGDVAFDAFQPGSCNWSFSDISYAEGPGSDPSGASKRELVSVGGSRSSHYSLDIWCIKVRKLDQKHPERCSSLRILNMDFADLVLDSLLRATPVDEQGLNTPTTINLETESIDVRFHDLDADRSEQH